VPNFSEVREVKARVQGRLFGIQGVHAVGVGHKLVKGQPTDDIAIMVYVLKKKPASELPAEEVIPAVIEGVKTDVYESDVPRPFTDGSRYDTLVGGIQIEPAGLDSGFAGTLGFIARSKDPVPKIFAVTCRHVVGMAPSALPTNLKLTSNATSIEFAGGNTPGSLVTITIWVPASSNFEPRRFYVLYVTSDTDTLDSIAANVVSRINATAVPGVVASVGGEPESGGVVITLTLDENVKFKADGAFGAHQIDASAPLQASVKGNKINMAGAGSVTGGAYIAVNVGGEQASFSAFASLAKGNLPPANAQAVADAVNKFVQDSQIQNLTAIPTNAQVSITGAQEIECDVSTDVRVGQPTNCFCSSCSPCCSRRIGLVFDVLMDPDAALIQLDAGIKYKAEIEGVGPITGTRPVTVTQVGVRKRGSASEPALTHGKIISLDLDGVSIEKDEDHSPPEWHLFVGFYTGAFSIGPGFSVEGDSGSAIVSEDANEIMGLLTAGSDTVTLASPIDGILKAFNIVVETATTAEEDVERTVPASAKAPIADSATTPVFATGLESRLRDAQRAIAATQAGTELIAVVERHADEARRLVNTNRRVATVWHRNCGPQIIQAGLGALTKPEYPLSSEIEGKPVTECLLKIQEIFSRYASPAFAADLNRMGPRIIELSGRSYNQALAVLREMQSSE